jgi:hypothetical protein
MRAIVLLAIVVPLVAACEPAPIGDYPDESVTRKRSRTKSAPGEGEEEGQTSGPSTENEQQAPASTFSLTVNIAGTGAGKITSTPEGLSCDVKTCKGTFPSGTKVTLKPTPDNGSFFVGWGGECTGDQPDACAPVMNADVSVSAELESIVGTWKGTYVGTRDKFGCTFNNAGDLTIVVTANGTTFSTSAQMNGLELRFVSNCSLARKSTGSAPATNVTVDSEKMTGTWIFTVEGASGTLDFPFTATIAKTTMTGTWNCTGCKGGGFNVTKQ